MSDKCGKRCAERGCQNPRLHVGPDAKFCVPCSKLVSAGKFAYELCLRCQYIYYEWANRVLRSPLAPACAEGEGRACGASETPTPESKNDEG